MKHLGDITKISGYEVEPVDIICGGSPCQDLSVAGKRAGLAGERSGLFMEQIRIIKEMRERGKADDVIRPRYMVWENVPGAFSSNRGEDFRAVLEETAKIADENATIPRPENGKWAPAGCIVGDGWSIAWRVHDAQFWGVAQRRKRICLLADFDGQTAGRILFELRRKTDDPSREQVIMDTREESRSEVQSVGKGVSRDIAQSGKEGQGAAGDVERSVGETGAISFQERAGKPGGGKGILIQNERTGALSTLNNQSVAYGICSYGSNSMKSDNPHSGIYQADTSRTLDLNGGNPACNQGGMVVLEGNGSRDSHKGDGYRESETMYTLNTVEQHAVCIENHPADSRVKIAKDGKVQTLSSRIGTQVAKGPGAVCTEGDNNAETRNQILCLLSETYGEETVEKWGIAILAALQSSEILQSGVHESSVSSETENRHKLDGGSLPCPSVAAGWLLRDMRKQQECGCSPHRRQSTEQQPEKSEKGMPELSQQNPQTCKEMFDMWEKGEGLGLLRQTLSEIQEVRQSFNGKGQSVHGCSIVRRLTPLEAERLQGFPDNWTDIGEWVDSKGKKHKGADSPRYKALGNSIALPFWQWMAERIVAVLKADGVEKPTMGSLFDGIGGFPLVFSRVGCDPIWASEIEDFPIAVTKKRFKEEKNVH